jgi:hypothetical protein
MAGIALWLLGFICLAKGLMVTGLSFIGVGLIPVGAYILVDFIQFWRQDRQ